MASGFEKYSDEELMEFILNGNHDAFAELVTRHTDKFYSLAYRTLFDKGDAEDVVQECFLKLWDKPKMWSSEKEAKFTTWFYKIIMNACLDGNKKKRPFRLDDNIDVADDSPDVEKELYEKAKIKAVEFYFRKLPKRQQTALNLCFYQGLSNNDAAEIMGLKLKALQSLLMRAKTSLKEGLESFRAGT